MTTEHRDHVANRAARRAAETAFKIVDKLRQELGYQMGAEEMSTRAVRALIRKAKQGDDQAMIAVVRLHQQQTAVPNPVSREIDAVLKEE